MAQMGFFDLSDRYASLDAKRDPLVEIDAVVPWEEFRPTLERVWRKPDAERKSRAGRKPIDAIVMFKTLVLSAQRWTCYSETSMTCAGTCKPPKTCPESCAGCISRAFLGLFWPILAPNLLSH